MKKLVIPFALAFACAEHTGVAAPPPLPNGQTIAFSGGALHVVNPEDHTLVIAPLDGAETKLAIGKRPSRAIAWGDRVYVSLRGERAIAVLADRKMLARIDVGCEPLGLAIDPTGARLYVAASLSDEIEVIDTERLEVIARIAVPGQPRSVAVHPSGRVLYVGTLIAGVQVIDLDRGTTTPAKIDIADTFRVTGDLAIAPDGLSLAVPLFVTKSTVVDQPSSYYGDPDTGPRMVEIELDPEIGLPSGRVTVIRITATITAVATSVAYSPAGEVMLISFEGGVGVAVYPSARYRELRGPILEDALIAEVPGGPSGVAFDDRGRAHFATYLDRGTTSVEIAALFAPSHGLTGWVPELGARWSTGLSPQIELGRKLFSSSMNRSMTRGGLVCATCHVDGRSDGLTWRVGQHLLQTRTLAEPIAIDHGPLGWLGDRKTIAEGAQMTSTRLGGSLSFSDALAVEAFIEALDPPDLPERGATSPEIDRGREVFAELGCDGCHGGADYTSRSLVRFFDGGPQLSVPSLRGLAATAPYLHDGSQPTLEAVVEASPAIGMGPTDRATPEDRRALVAFLRTL